MSPDRPGRAPAARLVPRLDDLPGGGWTGLDEPIAGDAVGEAELIDCVGPDFPRSVEMSDTAASPHFVRAPHQLVHGIGVVFSTDDAARRAAGVLRQPSFARCLGRSVAADLHASPAPAELLTLEVTSGPGLQRVTFNTASPAGVRPIHLDIVVVADGAGVSLLWFADTPDPFPPGQRRRVVERIRQRLHQAPPSERDPRDSPDD